MVKLNETPVRTSRNFQINNIKIDNVSFPKNIKKFENVIIKQDSKRDIISDKTDDFNIRYGVGLEEFINNNCNSEIKVNINTKTNKEIVIDYKINKNNLNLIEKIEIVLEQNTKSTIIIKYDSENDVIGFHAGIIKLIGKQNSSANIVIVNLFNQKSNNFLSIDNELEESADIRYTIVDFVGKNSITNYYSNLYGDNSNNIINGLYLGTNNQLFDLNYIVELRGKKSNENENCMLLSKEARSIALPMLLCQEEDVEGNHSTSSGKAGEKELFYIMSRGFSEKDALKLLVRAKFNSIIEGIKSVEIKNRLIYEIENRL